MRINGERLEQVERFKCLGSCINRDGRCEEELKARKSTARDALQKVKSQVTISSISIILRKRFVKTYI